MRFDPPCCELIASRARGEDSRPMTGSAAASRRCGGRPSLVGLGVDELSVPARPIAETQAIVRTLDLRRVSRSHEALAAPDAAPFARWRTICGAKAMKPSLQATEPWRALMLSDCGLADRRHACCRLGQPYLFNLPSYRRGFGGVRQSRLLFALGIGSGSQRITMAPPARGVVVSSLQRGAGYCSPFTGRYCRTFETWRRSRPMRGGKSDRQAVGAVWAFCRE